MARKNKETEAKASGDYIFVGRVKDSKAGGGGPQKLLGRRGRVVEFSSATALENIPDRIPVKSLHLLIQLSTLPRADALRPCEAAHGSLLTPPLCSRESFKIKREVRRLRMYTFSMWIHQRSLLIGAAFALPFFAANVLVALQAKLFLWLLRPLGHTTLDEEIAQPPADKGNKSTQNTPRK